MQEGNAEQIKYSCFVEFHLSRTFWNLNKVRVFGFPLITSCIMGGAFSLKRHVYYYCCWWHHKQLRQTALRHFHERDFQIPSAPHLHIMAMFVVVLQIYWKLAKESIVYAVICFYIIKNKVIFVKLCLLIIPIKMSIYIVK